VADDRIRLEGQPDGLCHLERCPPESPPLRAGSEIPELSTPKQNGRLHEAPQERARAAADVEQSRARPQVKPFCRRRGDLVELPGESPLRHVEPVHRDQRPEVILADLDIAFRSQISCQLSV